MEIDNAYIRHAITALYTDVILSWLSTCLSVCLSVCDCGSRYDFHLEDDMENGRYILEIDCPR